MFVLEGTLLQPAASASGSMETGLRSRKREPRNTPVAPFHPFLLADLMQASMIGPSISIISSLITVIRLSYKAQSLSIL